MLAYRARAYVFLVNSFENELIFKIIFNPWNPEEI